MSKAGYPISSVLNPIRDDFQQTSLFVRGEFFGEFDQGFA